MFGPYSSVVCLLSLDPCDITLMTDSVIADEQNDSRSGFWYLFASPYHPRSTDFLKFRILLNALSQSSKS